jgi:hypothetical protein
MMATQPALKASATVTADSPKGQEAIANFRAQYNKAGLDGDEAQNLNEHPGWAAYLAAGIRKFSATGPVFSVFLEIEVGGKSKDQLIAEMVAAGHSVSDWAKDIMSKPTWSPGDKQTVKFVRVKVSELGFTKSPKTSEVWARIQELGHSLCEPGDGPAIRLALKDQPRGDYFWTAMQQITDSDGGPDVFFVRRRDGGESWLHARWVRPDFEWRLGDGVVFRLRK